MQGYWYYIIILLGPGYSRDLKREGGRGKRIGMENGWASGKYG